MADLRASLPWRTKRSAAGTNATKKPTNIATITETPSPAPRNAEKLHVAHPHAPRIHENDEEEDEPRAECGEDPLDARVIEGPKGHEDDGAGQDHLVRDEARLEVGAGDHDSTQQKSSRQGLRA